MGSLVLTTFAIAIIIFQMSCQKTADAQTSNYVLPVATTTTLGGVKPDGVTILVDATGKISTTTSSLTDVVLYTKSPNSGTVTYEYWVCNRDGSNKRKITFPADLTIRDDNVSLLADRNSVIFTASTSPSGTALREIYTMNIDGSNLLKILSDGANNYDSR